jgi:hypothetical protein
MNQLLAVPFEYKEKEYCALVRVKPKGGHTELQVTIMNGDLEKAFFGHHIFIYQDDVLKAHIPADSGDMIQLQTRIGWALTEYLFRHPLGEIQEAGES